MGFDGRNFGDHPAGHPAGEIELNGPWPGASIQLRVAAQRFQRTVAKLKGPQCDEEARESHLDTVLKDHSANVVTTSIACRGMLGAIG